MREGRGGRRGGGGGEGEREGGGVVFSFVVVLFALGWSESKSKSEFCTKRVMEQFASGQQNCQEMWVIQKEVDEEKKEA